MTLPTDPAEGDIAGPVLADYAAALYTEECQRGEAIESRGRTVISSAGVMVTLLLALAAVGTRTTAVKIAPGPLIFIAAAVSSFALSAITAVATAAPQSAHLINPNQFEIAIKTAWDRPKNAALKRITATRIQEIADIQRSNTRKAVMLLTAISLEALAIIFLAATVLWIIAGLCRASASYRVTNLVRFWCDPGLGGTLIFGLL